MIKIKGNKDISLSELKLKKIEELDKACTQDIENGFYSTVNDVEYLWGFDNKTDQPNVSQQLTAIASGISPEIFYWKPKGDLSPIQVTIEQFKQMCIDAQNTKVSKIGKFWALKEQVVFADTIEKIEAIVW